jgi:ATP-dependent helicase/nuclease subunit A
MIDRHRTPPDNVQRRRALDTTRSVLVRAPAGSGKTDLLTRRFLRLLSEVSDPGEIVAITFTKAAAAEMRHRILAELEKAAAGEVRETATDEFSMESLAQRALARSRALGWNLVELPAQLRISTIDSFCRELALQEPILFGLGGSLEIFEQPRELYRRAARHAIEQIKKNGYELTSAIETLLLWRDNSWADLEDQIAGMLAKRDQWMQESFLDRNPDWSALRNRLERPFARAIRRLLARLEMLFQQIPGAIQEAHELARFACSQTRGALHGDLAELADFPAAPYQGADELDVARRAYGCLAELLLTGEGFRQKVDKRHGFPPEAKREKSRLTALIADLQKNPALVVALSAVRDLPSAHYSDEDWEIVRACFVLLRHAAAELRVAFAETGKADFVEIAQLAQRALRGEDDLPSDAAQAFADGIRHLLVDEFQDTSRRQYGLLAQLVAAWSGREGRTCFVVGDPMQSIYFFRDADAELFLRAEQLGLEIPGDLPLLFDSVQLSANFRSEPALVHRLNRTFAAIFADDDGSGIGFAPAEPARDDKTRVLPESTLETPQGVQLHLAFMPASRETNTVDKDLQKRQRGAALEDQTKEIVAFIQGRLERLESARAAGDKYRIAILGRARNALMPVAEALREAGIPFSAIELEPLKDRPEIVDALALVRAIFNPQDRVAWLGILRAPWCGLSLADLYTLTSADDDELISQPIPNLLTQRAHLLSAEGRIAAARVFDATAAAARWQSTQPTASLGTRMEQVWLRLGGAQCADATARANLDLFWRCLDDLPQGDSDLLGPALDASLADLKALPDPAASLNCGVHLMTIHGAKGLEFEVVIVPELQASSRQNSLDMLSWLERGLAPDTGESGEEDEITEFLIAPFPSKGTERGVTKAWVDGVRRERERQEMRRLLYVAATRAREELHLFARPEYRTSEDGSFSLAEPRESLLKTAWPALRDEIERRLEKWTSAMPAAQSQESTTISSLAASAENVISMPPIRNGSKPKPTLIRRLPSNFQLPPEGVFSSSKVDLIGPDGLYERHEGRLISRALGRAVHELLQQLALNRVTQTIESAQASLASLAPRIAARLRASGIEPEQSARISEQALAIVQDAAGDPKAQWILAPHSDAANEARWTGVVSGALRTVQVDRVFRAGPAPHSTAGSKTWWIVDYKTAEYVSSQGDSRNPESGLPALRSLFAPQIEAYAKVLRNLHRADAQIRGALYYPRMKMLDWWEL